MHRKRIPRKVGIFTTQSFDTIPFETFLLNVSNILSNILQTDIELIYFFWLEQN